MSARLKLKKLKRELELIRNNCEKREEEARYENLRCYKLLKDNIQEISTFAELHPAEMMRSAVDCLNYNVLKVTDSIVRKYAEQLAEYVRNQLMTKYSLNNFSTFSVKLLAPAINENHVKIEIREKHL